MKYLELDPSNHTYKELKEKPFLELPIESFIKARREGLGLSQAELADRTGLTEATVELIESGSGKVSLEDVQDVLWLFGHKLGVTRIKE